MKSAKLILCVLITVFSVFMIEDALAQCSQKLMIEHSSPDRPGEIKVKISDALSFEGRLIQIDGITEKVIKTFSGNNAGNFSFSALNKEYIYKVVVDFKDEEKFLCKQKIHIVDLIERE